MSKPLTYLFVLVMGLISIFPLSAQDKDTLNVQIDSAITILATRIPGKLISSPVSVQSIGKGSLQKAQQQISLTESLDGAAGVFALNSENFAQDLRVSIRGFGSRAAFGIRGIKVLVDGIPESTPDGQAQVDNIDIGLMENVEILRGPSAGLYGNASGGVIQLRSENPGKDFSALGRITLGSYDLRRYQVKLGEQIGKFGYLLYGSHTSYVGYRENSQVENNLLNAKLSWQLTPTAVLKLYLNHLNSPRGNDPGGINFAQAESDPQSARDRNLLFQSGETVTQSRIAASYSQRFGNNELQARVYRLGRNFANKLPFENAGIVELNRAYTGGGVSFGGKADLGQGFLDWKIGTDLDFQLDDRERFNNLEGSKGDRTFDQDESFLSWGTYGVGQWQFASKWNLLLSLRYDKMVLEAKDDFQSNGDDSGEINYDQFNPLAGLSYNWLADQWIYLNVSTSFETPALSELSNNPDGSGGFNPLLNPQKARNIEIGFKGSAPKWLTYDLALFFIEVEDELIPFELEDFPGRTFFRNAAGSSRQGVEVNLRAKLANKWKAEASYTYSDFIFDPFVVDGDDFSNNFLPGIAKNLSFFSLSYGGEKGFYGKLWTRLVGKVYLNNSNSTSADPYGLVNLRASYRFQIQKANIEPFLGINNLLDEFYFANVRINAFGSRFYEPGPGRAFFGGLSVSLN